MEIERINIMGSAEKGQKLFTKMTSSQANISFSDLCKLVELVGFTFNRQKGSHKIYTHEKHPGIMNFQEVKGKAKPMQITQLYRFYKRTQPSAKRGHIMAEYGFNILWSDEDQGFIATCADFPGLSAFGETPDEALAEANIALELFIETLQETGIELPAPTKAIASSGQVRLRMPKSLHGALVKNAKDEGVSLNTWLVTLLSERNSAAKIADAVCSKMNSLQKAINDHRQETLGLTFIQKADYHLNNRTGDPYGTTKAHLN